MTENHLTPVISIIIAVYNGADTLQHCLDSIFEQTYTYYEIIVIDGNSTDDTVKILKQNEARLSYWVSEPDKGIYDAWNKGLRLARGEWLSFIGCDDAYATSNSLAHLVSVATQEEGLEFVYGQAQMLDRAKQVRRIKGRPWRWSRFKRGMGIVVHPTALHHRSLFDRFGYFDVRYRITGDYDLMLRPGPNLRTAFLEEVVVKRGSEGVSNRFVIQAYKEAYKAHLASLHIRPVEAIVFFITNLFQYLLGSLKHWIVDKVK